MSCCRAGGVLPMRRNGQRYRGSDVKSSAYLVGSSCRRDVAVRVEHVID